MFLRSSALRPRQAYDLLTSLVVPRPIAWVSTRDATGHVNLAPFSYFTGLGSDPPMVTLGISDHRDGRAKDTLRIARDTGVLCISLVEEHDVERMNATSVELPSEVSEPVALGIEMQACAEIPCARVATARAALECRLVDVHAYGRQVRVNLLVCEVVAFHLDETLLDEDDAEGAVRASPHRVQPVSRLGQTWYARLGERFALVRPPR